MKGKAPMKKTLCILTAALLMCLTVCSDSTNDNFPAQAGSGSGNTATGNGAHTVPGPDGTEEGNKMEQNVFYIKAGDAVFTADFADNSSAEAMKALLSEGELVIEMSDYGNFEKVGSLGQSLPRNDRPITTAPGDVILYQGSSITVYYDTNSWNFTLLGKIRNATKERLLAAFGTGDVTMTFSLDRPGK